MADRKQISFEFKQWMAKILVAIFGFGFSWFMAATMPACGRSTCNDPSAMQFFHGIFMVGGFGLCVGMTIAAFVEIFE